MVFLKTILILVYILLSSVCSFAENKAYLEFEKTQNEAETILKSDLESSGTIESAVEFINDYFILPESLVFFIGGEDGPLYDSAENRITVPYYFVDEVTERFTDAGYEDTGVSVRDATLDSLMHTLFHEFAHAIIFMYDLPVLGKEEDAADGLASVLLIEFFEDGQDIVFSAADLFDLESSDRNILEEEDFWDEHSLDAQRYYNTLCHIYGSDPATYSFILKEEYFSKERAELCIEEYNLLATSWVKLLEPHLKN